MGGMGGNCPMLCHVKALAFNNIGAFLIFTTHHHPYHLLQRVLPPHNFASVKTNGKAYFRHSQLCQRF